MQPLDHLIIREAVPDDAPDLARLIDIAGEGIPSWLWAQAAAPGQNPLEIGEARARREQGGFSYRNALIATDGGRALGMVIAHAIEVPTEEDLATLRDLPAPIQPMVELEQHPMAVGTFYVNALAVRPGLRGRGIGSQLLQTAERRALSCGLQATTIQVYLQNQGALQLYQRHGYAAVTSRPVLLHPCQPYYDEDIVLLRKDLVATVA